MKLDPRAESRFVRKHDRPTLLRERITHSSCSGWSIKTEIRPGWEKKGRDWSRRKSAGENIPDILDQSPRNRGIIIIWTEVRLFDNVSKRWGNLITLNTKVGEFHYEDWGIGIDCSSKWGNRSLICDIFWKTCGKKVGDFNLYIMRGVSLKSSGTRRTELCVESTNWSTNNLLCFSSDCCLMHHNNIERRYMEKLQKRRELGLADPISYICVK